MTNEEIVKLRQLGYTLQDIGNIGGVSRQAISLRLKRYSTSIPIWETEASRIVGCTTDYLIRLRSLGLITPRKIGRHWVYSLEDIKKAQLSTQRTCPNCGTEFVMSGSAKYCSKCSTKRKKYEYPFLSSEAKKKANQSSRNWQKRNPEKVREALRKSREKLKARVSV